MGSTRVDFLPKVATPQAIPDATSQLNRKVEELEATVAKLTATGQRAGRANPKSERSA